jgi:hypothetical protein
MVRSQQSGGFILTKSAPSPDEVRKQMRKLTHQTLLNKLAAINVAIDDHTTVAEEKNINKLRPAVERAQKLKNECEELTEKYTNSVMELKTLVENICESKRLCKIVHAKLSDRTGYNNTN